MLFYCAKYLLLKRSFILYKVSNKWGTSVKKPALALGILFFSLSLLADEGLFPISELARRPEFRKAYHEFKGCGSIRIHQKEKIVITALHCVTNELDSITPTRSVDLGDNFSFDSLAYFSKLEGKVLKNGAKVLAAGSCFTGMDPEVLSFISPKLLDEAFNCAKGDWAILELKETEATACVKTSSANAESRITALGATVKNIQRSRGLLNLKGHVFTEGEILEPRDFMTDKRFHFFKLWDAFVNEYERVLASSYLITDADVMNGMSGGPIVDSKFNLVGVTTVALLPGNLWRYEGAHPFEVGHNYAIHGGIKIDEIKDQLKGAKLDPAKFFDCK